MNYYYSFFQILSPFNLEIKAMHMLKHWMGFSATKPLIQVAIGEVALKVGEFRKTPSFHLLVD